MSIPVLVYLASITRYITDKLKLVAIAIAESSVIIIDHQIINAILSQLLLMIMHALNNIISFIVSVQVPTYIIHKVLTSDDSCMIVLHVELVTFCSYYRPDRLICMLLFNQCNHINLIDVKATFENYHKLYLQTKRH